MLKNILEEQSFSLGIAFVDPNKIEKINVKYLGHRGATDVISFDYSSYMDGLNLENVQTCDNIDACALYGEIFICPDVAKEQAKIFKTELSEELLRYVIHGILHIKGYDDRTVNQRLKMRRLENKFIAQLRKHFDIRNVINFKK